MEANKILTKEVCLQLYEYTQHTKSGEKLMGLILGNFAWIHQFCLYLIPPKISCYTMFMTPTSEVGPGVFFVKYRNLENFRVRNFNNIDFYVSLILDALELSKNFLLEIFCPQEDCKC